MTCRTLWPLRKTVHRSSHWILMRYKVEVGNHTKMLFLKQIWLFIGIFNLNSDYFDKLRL
jgi:hypothetical protein